MTTRPGQYFTVFGALLAIAGGFVSWYEATVLFGGHTIELIDANGWHEPYAGLSIMAIGLCVTAGLVALAELVFRNTRRRRRARCRPSDWCRSAWGSPRSGSSSRSTSRHPDYASVGFLVSGCGAAFVAAGGLLSFAVSLAPRDA